MLASIPLNRIELTWSPPISAGQSLGPQAHTPAPVATTHLTTVEMGVRHGMAEEGEEGGPKLHYS